MDISQVMIPLLSGASVFSFANKNSKWGFIFGLIGQPFWFYSTFTGELWGMFAVSFWFAGNHVWGLINLSRKL